MRVKNREKVLEKVATSEKTTIMVGRQPGRQNSRQLKALGRREGLFARSAPGADPRTGAFTSRAHPASM